MLKIWFMYDNHTFAKIRNGNKAWLVAQAAKLFEEDGCGSIFVRDEDDGRIGGLTLHGKPREGANGKYGVTRERLEQWAELTVAEDAFRHRMHA